MTVCCLWTGASMSLMSETTFNGLWPRRSLFPSNVRLCAYSKEPIPVVGSINVDVDYKGQTAQQLPLLIVKGNGPTLLGRNWLQHVQLDWKAIHHVTPVGLEEVLGKHEEVFRDELGTYRDYEAHIEVEPGAQPHYSKARTVPYAMRDKVKEALQKMVDEGTLEPIQTSNWAAPIVPSSRATSCPYASVEIFNGLSTEYHVWTDTLSQRLMTSWLL